MNLRELIITSNGARKEIFDDYENASDYRWNHKIPKEKLVIYAGKSLDNVTLVGTGALSLRSKFSDTTKFSLCIETSTDVENITPRSNTTARIALNHLNLERFNRIHARIYIESVGYQGFYTHLTFGNDGAIVSHSPFLETNKWLNVVWECSHIKRNDCNAFSFTLFSTGCPPEAMENIKIYIDSITAEIVDPDYDEGWNLDGRIAYCHSGYLPVSKKIALTSIASADFFTVTNCLTNKVYKYHVKADESNLGKFYLLNFSNITEIGTYVLKIDDRETKPFTIDYISFDASIYKSLNFLRLLRCGEDIKGVHSACHLNCKTVHPDGRMVPNFGGWHDAGDVSQYEIGTAEITHSLLDLALSQKSNSFLYERLLEESKVGLHWLLRTRFGDGYRTMGVTYSIWRKNVLNPENQGIYSSIGEAGSFENFLSSAALAVGSRVFASEDEVFANWCRRSSIEDFQFALNQYEKNIYTKRWGPPITSQLAGVASLASCELYVLTNDTYYLDKGYEFAFLVIDCQEKGDAPLKGFFYEDVEHKYILSYEHRGHEQSPIQGLARLYQVSKDHPKKPLLAKSLSLYLEYVTRSMEYTKPYKLLPGHLYHIDKINIEHFTVQPQKAKEEALKGLINQVKTGVDLGGGWYLRIMPIAVYRRGFHATLLSKTKAVSMIYKTLGDEICKDISLSQLEWILGKNPFACSSMYGEGHNYHPLYVAFSRQMVGALPVGFKTKGDSDLPYWPTYCTSVFKEIWGHTTAKYLWILADLL